MNRSFFCCFVVVVVFVQLLRTPLLREQRVVNPDSSQSWARMERFISASSKRIQKGAYKTRRWLPICKEHRGEEDSVTDVLVLCITARNPSQAAWTRFWCPRIGQTTSTPAHAGLCLTAQQVAWTRASWCLRDWKCEWMISVWFQVLILQ